MSDLDTTFQSKTSIGRGQKLADVLSRHWFWIFAILYGLFVGIPFLAPVFMRLGLEHLAKAIYFIYSFLCHQLPERSIFLFGPKAMYSLGEIQAAWQSTLDPLVLRQFSGNPAMGWKVAWSDRMVSMYTGVLFFALLWWPLRKRLQPLPWWGLFVLLLPMAVDGTSHLISDLWGIEQGFRQQNLWLAKVTDYTFTAQFYAGNALGSFNSWMRWVSGALFGLGVVWFGFAHIERALGDQAG